MEKPILIYDFDGTLTPYAWTRFGILEDCGLEGGGSNPEFVQRVKRRAEREGSDMYAALWPVVFDYMRENGFALTDENFSRGAENLRYNPGVGEFVDELNAAGLENFILSSSIKVFLERTRIAPKFREIFATTFDYDDEGEVTGVDLLMNTSKKVEILRGIIGGKRGDAEDARGVIYVGDGLTDGEAMEYVKTHGGESVFVYQEAGDENLAKLQGRGVVSHAAKADYSRGSELWELMRRLVGLE